MAFKEGFNFRATVGYVTDPADTQFVAGTDTYPTTANGVTFGWSSVTGNTRDRNSGIDARLAGIVFSPNAAGPQITFRVDLDSAVEHEITLAVGDATSQQDNVYCDLQDNTTSFRTIDESPVPSQDFVDATDVVRTSAADWVSNNAVETRTFTSTILRAVIGHPSASEGSSVMAHLSIEETGGAPAAESELSLMMMGVGT